MPVFEGLHCCNETEEISGQRETEEGGEIPVPVELYHKINKSKRKKEENYWALC